MTTPVTELVALPDVKDHLNIPFNDLSQDGELAGFISAATAYIQNLTGPIVGQTFVETHNGGQPTIFVFHPPIFTVTSVVEYVAATGYPLTQVALGDPTGAYAFSVDDVKSGAIRRRYNGGLVGPFMGGDHNVTVTYVAGQAAVPADIRMAVLQDIAGLFQPSQQAANPFLTGNVGAGSGNAPLNPIGMFPRVSEILSGPSMRIPGIG